MGKADELKTIFEDLRGLLVKQAKGLDVRLDEPGQYELYGKKEATVGKKAVDGVYFASAAIRKRSVVLYFFPLYTHAAVFDDLPADLRTCLKGKTCFHIKSPDPALYKGIRALLTKGKKVYRAEGWV